jgi:hypothetical protein
MSLLTRLIDPDEQAGEEKIPIHQFTAAIAEYARGAPGVTVAALVAAFDLSASEEAALVAWYTAEIATGNLSRELVHDALLLGEGGQYTINQVKTRLNL